MVIGDVLARRTFDQSGDFTVKPFTIAFETHKITRLLRQERVLTHVQILQALVQVLFHN